MKRVLTGNDACAVVEFFSTIGAKIAVEINRRTAIRAMICRHTCCLVFFDVAKVVKSANSYYGGVEKNYAQR